MMHRSLGSRVFTALFAPWFALVMAEPASLHTCSEHSLHGVIAADALHDGLTERAGYAGHAGHAGHGRLQHDHGMADQSAPPVHERQHQCTCIGGCCAAQPVSAPAGSALSWLPAAVRTQQPLASAQGIRRSAAAHVLPFANGPPAARA
ncbi:MAG TPA: hypothetical protein VHE78_15670 [Gemmatimonadaceae bacterium]|nr:hypothetical protein [Gemmatimonadaceae bacterium]